MIIHKVAGTTIYSKQISMELDSDLIGGFLTAISQFRSEIQKPGAKSTQEKGFQMDYYDFKIIIHDGSYVRVALILDGPPSKQLEINQKMFTERFEAKFSPLIKDFSGDVRPFSETDILIEEYFNISIMYPHQLATHWDVSKLEKLDKALLEVGEPAVKYLIQTYPYKPCDEFGDFTTCIYNLIEEIGGREAKEFLRSEQENQDDAFEPDRRPQGTKL